ncbi:MAG: MBL fold metallo-hydrolase [Prevotella sp.]|nr:MBL fold metallo-hydrolase [Prevotella sp.]
MLNIKKFVCNMLQENCYVVSDETHECVIIDCGAFYPEEHQAIVEYIQGEQLVPKHLLCTHGHLDHTLGNGTIQKTFNLLPEVHEEDAFMVADATQHPDFIAPAAQGLVLPEAGILLHDGDIIEFGNHKLKVISTPGHSRGSVFFYCEEEAVAFSGDTLFRHSIGRTDFKGGSMFSIIQSLRMICQLPDKTVVYPGHGPQTTIGEEVAHNPYIDR